MTDIESRLTAALEGRYTLERPLGEGGMATVWLARDVKHDRHVAIKVLKPELAAMLGGERFLATYGGWAVSDQAVQPELVELAADGLILVEDVPALVQIARDRWALHERLLDQSD